jgi:acid phosphatase family membrane protein YuiD
LVQKFWYFTALYSGRISHTWLGFIVWGAMPAQMSTLNSSLAISQGVDKGVDILAAVVVLFFVVAFCLSIAVDPTSLSVFLLLEET